MLSLIENEVVKVLYRRKLGIVFLIITLLVLLFAYGEHYRSERTMERMAERLGIEHTGDWRPMVEQQLRDHQNRLDNPYITDSRRASIQLEVEQYEYYLEKGINPLVMGSATFTRSFMEQSILLFLPLLVMVLVTDIVSGEYSSRTIKLLLTKPIPRWKILMSKLVTMLVLVTILAIMIAAVAATISSILFGYGGWNAPVPTGFTVINGHLDTTNVVNIPQWQLIFMVYGLAWVVGITIGALTLMVSVLVKNTGIAIGVMMSVLIAGGFMRVFLNDWPIIKYLFMLNLNITNYLSGSMQPVEGMTFLFSFTVLVVWAFAAIVISFYVFNKQDVLA
ncbi:ABC transporter permease [Desulfuribacillus alkaliarsenatis]|uniref:ABC transporter permease n=1 Tax=Desulfuribacillus alkaliarsenatis TaxID=766136 RepID=A0A1E5FZ38_9FIRM|nr:ABC transporter permease [Desulfuribacillus alkaliarsenatis]OEF95846.1 ABC transporter permease [Desulfuribacillus alkaliarsenatis]